MMSERMNVAYFVSNNSPSALLRNAVQLYGSVKEQISL
jgi:hypothetical protein